jgi:hypothetical protein
MSTYTATTVPTQFVEANGILFAYRRWGKRSGLPLSLTYTHRADPNSSRVSNYSLTGDSVNLIEKLGDDASKRDRF